MKPSALPGALRRRAGACLHAFTHPGARAAAVLCLLSALLFVLYFQFFFGPPLLTLAVLAVCAYAGLTAYNAARDAMARTKDEPSRVAGFPTRHTLQDSWVFLLCAAVSLLSNLFFLLMARLNRSTWFGVFALYNLVLFAVNLFIGREMRRLAAACDAPAREKKDARIVGVLLLSLALVFTGISVETILRNQSKAWPSFVLAFQILFACFRLALYGHSAYRCRNDTGTLTRAVKNVNLSCALCALYTALATFLARFCGDEILRLALNLAAVAVILTLLLRLSLVLITDAGSGRAAF